MTNPAVILYVRGASLPSPNALFGGTEADMSEVIKWVNQGSVDASSEREEPSDLDLHMTLLKERFESHLRHRVAGFDKESNLLLAEVQSIKIHNPERAHSIIESSIATVRQAAIEHQWFEILPELDAVTIEIHEVLAEDAGRQH